MQTVKEILNDLYLGKRVKITIGHPSNNQHIIAKVLGFENGPDRAYFFILLDDIIAFEPDYSESVKNMIKSGTFNRHYFRLDTEIGIVRDENLSQLLGNN